MKIAESSPNGWKTLWEKEELLVMSNFSCFPQCFRKTCTTDTLKAGLVWERVNTLQHNSNFRQPWERHLLKTLSEKRGKCRSPTFSSFSTKCSLLPNTNFNFFSHIYFCLQMLSIWTSLKYVFRERFKCKSFFHSFAFIVCFYCYALYITNLSFDARPPPTVDIF